MKANEFVSKWDNVVRLERARAEAAGVPEVADDLLLVTAQPTILGLSPFPSDAANFLVEAGLPQSCIPFLSFRAIARGPLPLVQYYGTQQFLPPDILRLAPFFVIGSEGAGNPLCLDCTRRGEVVVLDHEDCFRTRTFVASNIATLAEALLILHTVPKADFVQNLQSCDPLAADEASFLPTEVSMLRR